MRMGGRKNPGPPLPLRQVGETLCWHCRNAAAEPRRRGPGCSWSRKEHAPVPGWTAERRDVQIQKDSRRRVNGDLESYRVLACPEFEEG